MRFLPHAHRISLLSPAPVSHIFHSCRPSMPRKQKAALVPTPIKQNHEAMVVSYRPQTLHDTIHTVLPGEVLPAIPSYSEFIAVRLFVFQLTASRRGWHRISDILNFSTVISTNSLTKRLTNIGVTTSQQMIHFNSQPHEEADGGRPHCRKAAIYFNSQPHEEADTKVVEALQTMIQFQLTASRRGWPIISTKHCGKHSISTHSLTKRLTSKLAYVFRARNISTHSLTKRLTEMLLAGKLRIKFQLTASRRGWQSRDCIFDCSVCISTHSLTKRLTIVTIVLNVKPLFQLTASRRGWRYSCGTPDGAKRISTHSLTKRLTGSMTKKDIEAIISTHSLTKRLTGFLFRSCQTGKFQLTASRRGWRDDHVFRNINLHFNSQPHEEADGVLQSVLRI